MKVKAVAVAAIIACVVGLIWWFVFLKSREHRHRPALPSADVLIPHPVSDRVMNEVVIDDQEQMLTFMLPGLAADAVRLQLVPINSGQRLFLMGKFEVTQGGTRRPTQADALYLEARAFVPIGLQVPGGGRFLGKRALHCPAELFLRRRDLCCTLEEF